MMKLRWLWSDYTEPAWGLDRQQRREVHRIARRAHLNPVTWYVWLAATILVSVVQGVLFIPLAWLFSGIGVHYALIASYAMLTVPVCVGVVWSHALIYRHPIRRAMRDLGYDVCIRCGYWLKGLDARTPNCPECGEARPVDESSPSPTV